MRTRVLAVGLLAALVAIAVPARALAITPDEVVALKKAGVSDEVILAVIARDNTPIDLAADQLVALKQQGVSDAVVLAMLKSGRGETPQAPITVLAPDVVIIGHGPDVPNTFYWDRLYWNPTYVIPFIPSYLPPFATVGVPHARPIRPRRATR
jgi:hypothetical protein